MNGKTNSVVNVDVASSGGGGGNTILGFLPFNFSRYNFITENDGPTLEQNLRSIFQTLESNGCEFYVLKITPSATGITEEFVKTNVADLVIATSYYSFGMLWVKPQVVGMTFEELADIQYQYATIRISCPMWYIKYNSPFQPLILEPIFQGPLTQEFYINVSCLGDYNVYGINVALPDFCGVGYSD